MRNILSMAFIGISFGALLVLATIGLATLAFTNSGAIHCELAKDQP